MITLIGAGNVASWLAFRLRNSQAFHIGQVFSRNLEHAQRVAELSGASAINDLQQLDPHSDLCIFSLSDDAYPEVLSQLPFEIPVALHTAGSVSQTVFKRHAKCYGVLYPLQTFTSTADLEHLPVPLCIENDRLGEAAEMVDRLAAALSDIRCVMSEKQRATVHLAAVFACNFSNAMYTIADELLKKENADIQLLLPLLQQTLDKLSVMAPKEAQTGPAKRGDRLVMARQLLSLPDPQMQEIYRAVSDYILKINE